MKWKMLQEIKKCVIVWVLPCCLILSCAPAQERAGNELETSHSDGGTDTLSELSQEQEAAFDALNILQRNTDEMGRLYSTFANIQQPCYPADTSFMVSQSQLLIVMKQFISNNCTGLAVDERNELASTAVLAQDAYKVLHCTDHSFKENYENGLPTTGTWVIPDVLEQRDVVLVW